MLVERRRFLVLGAVVAPALWLQGRGILTVPASTLRILGGCCSFCARSAEDMVTTYGVVERPTRICNQCIALCLDILDEESKLHARGEEWLEWQRALAAESRRPAAGGPAEGGEELERWVKAELGRARSLVAARARAPSEPARIACSFCDRPEDLADQLIGGPAAVFVCDVCVAGVVSLRTVVRA